MEARGVRGKGRQRPDPGRRAETQLARLMEEALGGFGAVAWVSPGRILSRKISRHKALFEQL